MIFLNSCGAWQQVGYPRYYFVLHPPILFELLWVEHRLRSGSLYFVTWRLSELVSSLSKSLNAISADSPNAWTVKCACGKLARHAHAVVAWFVGELSGARVLHKLHCSRLNTSCCLDEANVKPTHVCCSEIVQCVCFVWVLQSTLQ